MSAYYKVVSRFGFLAVLVAGILLFTHAPKAEAQGGSCGLACFHQEEACFFVCQTMGSGQFGCREACIQTYDDCIAAC